jgi:hypothetical protein
LFGGMFWDGEIELYLLRHNPTANDPFPDPPNYMNPKTGRVLSRASSGPQTGRNAFTFAGDNPWSSRKIDAKKQKQWLPANFRITGGGGAGGGGGAILRGQDVYVWKLCSCGKKGCPNCPKKKSSSRGGSGLNVMFNPKEYTITKAMFNPKEISIDKPVPWNTKKEEGGRHTPFHNKMQQTSRVIVRGWDPKPVRPIIGKGSPGNARTTFAVLLGHGSSEECGFGTASDGFRKILDYGEAGDNAGVLLRRRGDPLLCGTTPHL